MKDFSSDEGIIRNKLKVNAAIINAQKIIELQKEYGSFKGWLDLASSAHKEEMDEAVQKNFRLHRR